VDDDVRALASAVGIANDWIDANDQPQRVAIRTLRTLLRALGFPCDSGGELQESTGRLRERKISPESMMLTATTGKPIELPQLALQKDTPAEVLLEGGGKVPVTLRVPAHGPPLAPAIDEPGYHRLRVADKDLALAVAPPRCVTIDDIAPGEKTWGLAVQLYSLRRDGDGGIGDTRALSDLAASAARHGADAIALSPTHSLFPADPNHYGPYSPSSRLFRNPLHADPAAVFGEARVAASAADAPQREQLEDAPLIDWPAASRAKYRQLRLLFDDFAEHDLGRGTALDLDFQSFVRDGGEQLKNHAVFEALQRWRLGDAQQWSWRDWPAPWRDPASAEVAHFAEREAATVRFHVFLQWVADRAFAAAQRRAREAGLRIGLISDLAIGLNPAGSQAWSRQQDLLLALSVGAPPDMFNMQGQDWGLTALSPQALLGSGFAPFIDTLRAGMRHAGGVRIDHAMGLTRLWLVPRGHAATEGAYLRYPGDDLIRLIALESHRHRAIVIGEDLGTVPPEFRDRLARCGIAGMDVLWFQRKGKTLLKPSAWRRDAVAMTTTHDLPTVAGWWSGADIAMRAQIGLCTNETAECAERSNERILLWDAFVSAKAVTGKPPPPEQPARAVDAAIKFTAQAPAPLALIPIEDMLGLLDQPNLPGTVDQHPNWRRRLNQPASHVLDARDAQPRIKTLRDR
jgi:4-alpha-glucanotransferase